MREVGKILKTSFRTLYWLAIAMVFGTYVCAFGFRHSKIQPLCATDCRPLRLGIYRHNLESGHWWLQTKLEEILSYPRCIDRLAPLRGLHRISFSLSPKIELSKVYVCDWSLGKIPRSTSVWKILASKKQTIRYASSRNWLAINPSGRVGIPYLCPRW